MLFVPQILSLITTHKCNAACDHCCFDCNPSVTKAIPIPRLYSLIDEAKEIETLKLIVFTGGECFLLGADLINLIAKASNNNFFTRCVTNGYWGKNLSYAKKKALELKDNGLGEINFSTGSIHSEYVEAQCVINSAIACARQGIKSLITIETYKNDGFDVNQFSEHPEIKELSQKGILNIQRNVWMKNGGENDFQYDDIHSRFNPKNKNGCSTLLNALTINPDQDLIACCGLHLEKIPELKLGSLKDNTLLQLFENVQIDYIKIWIHLEGPERILEFVKKHDPSYDLPTSSVHICETCLHLYKDEKAQKVIKENFHEIKHDIINKYYSSLTFKSLSRLESNLGEHSAV